MTRIQTFLITLRTLLLRATHQEGEVEAAGEDIEVDSEETTKMVMPEVDIAEEVAVMAMIEEVMVVTKTGKKLVKTHLQVLLVIEAEATATTAAEEDKILGTESSCIQIL